MYEEGEEEVKKHGSGEGGAGGSSHQQSMHGAEVCAGVEVFLQGVLHRLVLTQNLQEEIMMMVVVKVT